MNWSRRSNSYARRGASLFEAVLAVALTGVFVLMATTWMGTITTSSTSNADRLAAERVPTALEARLLEDTGAAVACRADDPVLVSVGDNAVAFTVDQTDAQHPDLVTWAYNPAEQRIERTLRRGGASCGEFADGDPEVSETVVSNIEELNGPAFSVRFIDSASQIVTWRGTGPDIACSAMPVAPECRASAIRIGPVVVRGGDGSPTVTTGSALILGPGIPNVTLADVGVYVLVDVVPNASACPSNTPHRITDATLSPSGPVPPAADEVRVPFNPASSYTGLDQYPFYLSFSRAGTDWTPDLVPFCVSEATFQVLDDHLPIVEFVSTATSQVDTAPALVEVRGLDSWAPPVTTTTTAAPTTTTTTTPGTPTTQAPTTTVAPTTTTTAVPLGPPSGLSAPLVQAEPWALAVGWTPPAATNGASVQSYEVRIYNQGTSTLASTPYASNTITVTCGGNPNPCALSGGRIWTTVRWLEEGQGLSVAVRARNSYGWSAMSPSASGTPSTITAPSFVGAGAAVQGTPSVQAPMPAGLQANDLLVAVVMSKASSTYANWPPFVTITQYENNGPWRAPSGWTIASHRGHTAIMTRWASSASTPAPRFYTPMYDTTQTTGEWNFSSNRVAARIYAYRNTSGIAVAPISNTTFSAPAPASPQMPMGMHSIQEGAPLVPKTRKVFMVMGSYPEWTNPVLNTSSVSTMALTDRGSTTLSWTQPQYETVPPSYHCRTILNHSATMGVRTYDALWAPPTAPTISPTLQQPGLVPGAASNYADCLRPSHYTGFAISVRPTYAHAYSGRSGSLQTVWNRSFGDLSSVQVVGPYVRVQGRAALAGSTTPINVKAPYRKAVGNPGLPPAVALLDGPIMPNSTWIESPANKTASNFFGLGTNHGYDFVIPADAESNKQVCVFSPGPAFVADSLLGCRTVQMPTGPPFGTVDSIVATGSGTVRIQGWAIDPENDHVLTMNVHVNGVPQGGGFQAGTSRPDVSAAHPGYHSNHGFNTSFYVGSGIKEVCVWALDRTAISSIIHTKLGCRTLLV